MKPIRRRDHERAVRFRHQNAIRGDHDGFIADVIVGPLLMEIERLRRLCGEAYASMAEAAEVETPLMGRLREAGWADVLDDE